MDTSTAKLDTHPTLIPTVSGDAKSPKGRSPIAGPKRHRHGLTGGSLPSGCGNIKKYASRFRLQVEKAVEKAGVVLRDADGEFPLFETSLINSAMRWERHALLTQRWLRLEAMNMTAAERLAYSREIATASSNRDKCLERLGLQPAKAKNIWDALYASRQDVLVIHEPVKTTMDGQAANQTTGSDSRADNQLQKASADGSTDA
jgi:hypothetical protein